MIIPTDILILTDTLSSGAASNFIKTLHNNGGAIIASYGGNPKLNKDAIKYDKITYEEIISKSLKVIDSSAAGICKDNKPKLHNTFIIVLGDRPLFIPTRQRTNISKHAHG